MDTQFEPSEVRTSRSLVSGRDGGDEDESKQT